MLYLFIFYLFHFGKKHENCIGQKKYSWKKFKAKTKISESHINKNRRKYKMFSLKLEKMHCMICTKTKVCIKLVLNRCGRAEAS